MHSPMPFRLNLLLRIMVVLPYVPPILYILSLWDIMHIIHLLEHMDLLPADTLFLTLDYLYFATLTEQSLVP